MFIQGQVYRRKDLHNRYGGQQQGGISTPTERPIILLFTNDNGTQYGYQDGWQDNGLFLYTGEGQRGDMRFVAGNRAVRDHSEDAKDLHLFDQAQRSHVRYVGQFVATGYETRVTTDIDRASRNAIVFELTPSQEFDGSDPFDETPSPFAALTKFTDLTELRALAIADAAEARDPLERRARVRRRSQAIRQYVFCRSKGVCEACEQAAPFLTMRGTPYLEPHHIRRLSDGGPDHPSAVAAICPNCHRNAHYGLEGEQFNAVLLAKIRLLEGGRQPRGNNGGRL